MTTRKGEEKAFQGVMVESARNDTEPSIPEPDNLDTGDGNTPQRAFGEIAIPFSSEAGNGETDVQNRNNDSVATPPRDDEHILLTPDSDNQLDEDSGQTAERGLTTPDIVLSVAGAQTAEASTDADLLRQQTILALRLSAQNEANQPGNLLHEPMARAESPSAARTDPSPPPRTEGASGLITETQFIPLFHRTYAPADEDVADVAGLVNDKTKNVNGPKKEGRTHSQRVKKFEGNLEPGAEESQQRNDNRISEAFEPSTELRLRDESIEGGVNTNTAQSDIEGIFDKKHIVANTIVALADGSDLISLTEPAPSIATSTRTPTSGLHLAPKVSDFEATSSKDAKAEKNEVKKDTERPNEQVMFNDAIRRENTILPPGLCPRNRTQENENGAAQVTKTDIVKTTSQQTRRQAHRATSEKDVRGTSDKNGQPEKHTKDDSSCDKKEQPMERSPASLGLSGGIFGENVDKAMGQQPRGQTKKRIGSAPQLVRGTCDKNAQSDKRSISGKGEQPKERTLVGLSGSTSENTGQSNKPARASSQPAAGISEKEVDNTKAQTAKEQPKKCTENGRISGKEEHSKKRRPVPAGPGLSRGRRRRCGQSQKHTRAAPRPAGSIAAKNVDNTVDQQPNGQHKERAGAGAQLTDNSDKERQPGKRTGNGPVFGKADQPKKRALLRGTSKNTGPPKKHTRVGLRPAGRSSGRTGQPKKRTGADLQLAKTFSDEAIQPKKRIRADPGLAKGIPGKEPRKAYDKRDSNPSNSSTDGDHRPLPGSNNPNQEGETYKPELMETDTDGSKETHPDCVKVKNDGGELEETITGFESTDNPTELGAEREPQPCIDDIVTEEDIDEFCLTCGDPVGHDHVCVENVTERIIDDRRTF